MLTGPGATIGKARILRKEMSLPEVLLWQELRRRPGGFKFRRQHPAGPFILDFVCLQARLAIEIDGQAHDSMSAAKHDEDRDEWLIGQGYRTLRVPARHVLDNLEGVIALVIDQCAAGRPLHHASHDEQVRNAPGIPQPCRGHGDLLIPPRTGEDLS